MKSIYPALIFILMLLSIQMQSQTIQSITIDPPNPTDTDTIHFYIELSFPSGPCDEKTITQTTHPPNLYASAIHCLGLLTVICNHTDTVTYYQLPVGNYQFTFQADAGAQPAPCTPGINPGPSQSINFTVLPATGQSDFTLINNFSLQPNPAKDFILIDLNENIISDAYDIKIYDIQGKELISTNEYDINTEKLNSGIYFVHIINTKNNLSYNKKLVICK